jgi:hypothetical protein
MEADVHVESVEEKQTRSGKTRYVLRDGDGREYTTFRPAIGREAARFEGRPARISFHEEERNGFQNVYLDGIEAAAEAAGGEGEGQGRDPDEVAWSAAIEAAPWLVGSREPSEPVPPEELYDTLEPFKRLVAEDMDDRPQEDDEG